MSCYLEVRVLYRPGQGELVAEGNCVVARRGGKEAGGKAPTRGTRTAWGCHVGRPRRTGRSPIPVRKAWR